VIAGIGIDLVEVRRVQRLLDRHGARFLQRCFHTSEIQRPADAEHLAGLLAAKEAAFKALSLNGGGGVGWKSFQVLQQVPGGPPSLVLSDAAARHARTIGIVQSHLSITHHGGMAAAVVILET